LGTRFLVRGNLRSGCLRATDRRSDRRSVISPC